MTAVLPYAVQGTGLPGTRAALLGIGSGLFNGLALLTFYRAAAGAPMAALVGVLLLLAAG